MNNPIMIPMTIASDQVCYDMSISSSVVALSMKVDTAFVYAHGHMEERSAIPGEELQILEPREGFDGMSKVIIAPIPENYGRLIRSGMNLKVY